MKAYNIYVNKDSTDGAWHKSDSVVWVKEKHFLHVWESLSSSIFLMPEWQISFPFLCIVCTSVIIHSRNFLLIIALTSVGIASGLTSQKSLGQIHRKCKYM